VTARLEETSLHRILEMVGQEIGHKSGYVRIADRIVKWFVPLVVTLAFLTGFYCLIFNVTDGSQTVMQTAVIRMVSVLLISCPCAIGIAAPLVESYLLNTLAKCGIIVRNRGCLAFLGRETVFAFDKTGTVTEGRFEVCAGLDQVSDQDKKILKGMVAHSIHPIAVALNQALCQSPCLFEKIEEKVGKGMRGIFEGRTFTLGSKMFLEEQGIFPKPSVYQDSQALLTTVYFAENQSCIATIELGDRLKEDIQCFIQSLSAIKTLLLSGDAQASVEKVARSC
jgi:P-type E1-E2 ATPase